MVVDMVQCQHLGTQIPFEDLHPDPDVSRVDSSNERRAWIHSKKWNLGISGSAKGQGPYNFKMAVKDKDDRGWQN